MGFWSNIFETTNPEKYPSSEEKTSAKVKVDNEGFVSDMIYGLDNDTSDSKSHGHVWGLNSNEDSDIGGRESKDD